MRNVAGLGAGLVIGAAVLAALAAGGLYLGGRLAPKSDPATLAQPATPPAAAPAPAPVAEPAAVAEPAPAAAPTPLAESDEASDTALAAIPDAAETPPLPEPPGIDTFRLEPDGQTIIAGRGEPGADVSILLDGETIASVIPDQSGKFVGFLDLSASDKPRVLTLAMKSTAAGETLPSRDEIIIAPTPQPVETATAPEINASEPNASEASVAEAEPLASPNASVPVAVAQDPVLTAETSKTSQDMKPSEPQIETVQQAPMAEPSSPSGTAAPVPPPSAQPTVLLSGDAGIRVLQAPASGPASEGMANVALDAITYSDAGDVQLSGRARGDGFVRIYLDNLPVTTSPIDPGRNWQAELPTVDTGVYRLRVDEVNEEGDVISRVETPFKREDHAVLSAQSTDDQSAPVAVVTVQPGSTLWAISREAYGEGILYVRVFEANRDRIRDPDLIYPGQVFSIPQ